MPATLLAGVDIGGTKTAVVLSSGAPEVLGRRAFPTRPERGPGQAIEQIVSNLRDMLVTSTGSGAALRAIGVSCGSPLDPVRGVIQQPPNLPSWVDVPITEILAREFKVPCYLENDANAGALAERAYGAGKQARHMVFLTVGTGLGAGLILNGELYRGMTNDAGEIGHVRLTPHGPRGYNKDGSVEGWASGGGMAQVAQMALAEATARGENTLLADAAQSPDGLTARAVAAAAERGDAVAEQVIRTAGARLGEAMAILVDLLNPERILAGGLALRLGEKLLGPARAVVAREALGPAARACQILPAGLGEEIGDVAALCVALEGERHAQKA